MARNMAHSPGSLHNRALRSAADSRANPVSRTTSCARRVNQTAPRVRKGSQVKAQLTLKVSRGSLAAQNRRRRRIRSPSRRRARRKNSRLA